MSKSEDVAVSVTKSVYSQVYYQIYDSHGMFVKEDKQVAETAFIDLTLKPKEDQMVYISVRSGDGKAQKVYRIYFQYPRTMQEAVKISSYPIYKPNDDSVLNQRSYQLEIGTPQGERIRNTDTVLITDPATSASIHSCTRIPCEVPDPLSSSNEIWHIKVIRGGQTIAEGDYRYDSVVPMQSNDLGISISALTKQELIDDFVKHADSSSPYEFAYRAYLDLQKLQKTLPNAKYFAHQLEFMGGTLSSLPQGLTMDDWKATTSPNGYPGYSMGSAWPIRDSNGTSIPLTSSYYHQSDDEMDSIVHDAFVRFAFYDENMNVIGQTVLVLQFDEAHLPDGYTPAKNWTPAQK